MDYKVPRPTIYLRNKFLIKPGLHGQFFRGQRALLEHLNQDVELIAACGSGSRPLLEGEAPPTRLPRMLHIWQLPKWSTLYKLMWSFSESDWYADEVSSLQIEHQDLLVRVGPNIPLSPRPQPWPDESEPNYVYVYQELRLNPAMTRRQYLKHLYWVTANVEDRGWHLQWAAAEITGTPSQICLLWRVDSEKLVEETPHWLATDEETRDRYTAMMLGLGTFYQEVMAPESTEIIDTTVRNAQ